LPKSVESPTGRVEGVRREAPDSGPALSCRPTTSKHPYRPLAAFQPRTLPALVLALLPPLHWFVTAVVAAAARLAPARRRHAAAARLAAAVAAVAAPRLALVTVAAVVAVTAVARAAAARRCVSVGSPPRRQHRNEATTGLLRGYYESYYEATTGLLRGYYVATTRLLQGYYQATTRLPLGYYKATTRSRPRATRPAAQQRQHRSSAGAARLGSSEPALTIRTPRERSR
jgi:hypothetical protein